MKQRKTFRERISVRIAKNPGGFILTVILLFNLCFFMVAAAVISQLAPSTVQYRGFWASVFYTISMVLDAGCIQLVVEDVGNSGVAVIIVCIVIVIVGMITFTGAVIGYVTNYISDFISGANRGDRRLSVSNHTVILNWNSRASEIINDMLYCERPEQIVVLVPSGKETVEKEIADRLADTMEKERTAVRAAAAGKNPFAAWRYYRKNMIKNRVTVIVREGDTFSTKKLSDISIKKAKAVIILCQELQNSVCKFDYQDKLERYEKGNSNTVKTLIQIAELTGASDSADDQKVIVEVDDAWTMSLVNRIIAHKERQGKSNIVPVSVDMILGQILSQFSIMPELNMVYGELFSNKGAAFFSEPADKEGCDHNAEYMKNHLCAVPLTEMDGKEGPQYYYMAAEEKDLKRVSAPLSGGYTVKLNRNFWLEKRNIIILGHNSNSTAIMEGFNAFRDEWNFRDEKLIEENGGPEILNIRIIDDKKSLDKHGHYAQYPYVNRVIEADVYDKDEICAAINEFVDANENDTSVLILSDDSAPTEETDAAALTYLIYVQDIISERMAKDPGFDPESIDVIVEIINPKNYDIVHSYSIDNIVISNRYISKMVTQIGEKEAIYNFYNDILTYDTGGTDVYNSKELYAKKVRRFFAETPKPCTAAELIRAVYEASPEDNKSIVLGYVQRGRITIFSGNQSDIKVALEPNDKIILFSNH